MKYSLPWLLTSSALVFSLHPLMAANTDLSSSDNYENGSSGSAAFTAKETSDASGTTYTLTSDVSITNVSAITPADKSCFTNTGGALSFVGADHSLVLQTIALTHDGAAINNTNTALSFSGFSSLLIDSAPATGTSGGKGAICVTNTEGGTATFTDNASVTLQKNTSEKDGAAVSAYSIDLAKTTTAALLDQNTSTKNGGALCSTANTTVQGNSGTVTFSSNTATDKGGGIYSKEKDSTLDANTGVVTFKSNTAKTGGAWSSDDNLALTGNTQVLFQENKTTGSAAQANNPEGCGGAICCYLATATDKTGLAISQNQEMSFTSNTTTANGGAIYATKCTLDGNTTLTFDQNTATAGCGGAIYTETEDFSLKGSTGTVTFSTNTAKTGGALYSKGNSSLTGNTNLLFSGNKATGPSNSSANQEGCGGAILAFIDSGSVSDKTGLSIANNQEVSLTSNAATVSGGAIYATKCTLTGNGSLTFDGNTAGTSGGAIYTETEDFTLTGSTGTVTFSTNTAKTGGALYSKGNNSLSGNTNLLFSGNKATGPSNSSANQEGCGGAILSFLESASVSTKKGLWIEDNENVSLSGNTATVSGGAIYATKCALHGNTTLTFDGNTAETAGGAIYTETEDFTLTGSTGTVTFSTNTAKTAGALHTKGNTSFTKNKALVFSGNSATATATTTTDQEGCGGAILCNISESDIATKSLTLTENESLSFINNTAKRSGGGIYAPKCVISGSESINFDGNTAETSGGAIYSKNLSITANGPVSFTNNSGGKGGAIYIADSGELSLEAIDGDITFSGNRATEGTSTPNSIHLGAGAKITKLAAAPGHTIYFYDPITMEAPASGGTIEELVINPVVKAIVPPPQPKNGPIASVPVVPVAPANPNTGTIVFSSGKLPSQDASIPANTTTILNQKINLAGGNVVLKEGATLQVYSFTQQPDSTVFMDAGTTLETTTTNNTDGSIDLKNLSVNLDALDGKRMITIAVNSTSGGLKISGDLKFHNNEGSFYDNPGLKANLNLPFLDLSSTSGTVNLDDFNPIPSSMAAPDYGYQGSWTLVPKVGAGGKVTLVAEWQALGYTPKPELRATLVPNSLWNAYVNIHSIQQEIATAMSDAPSHPGIWIGGIGNAFHQDKQKENAGFRLISRGYIVGGSMTTPQEYTFAVAFSQLFGKSKDYVVSDIKSQVYAGSLCAQSSYVIPLHSSLRRHVLSKVLPELPGETPLVLHGQVSYGRNHHNMTTKLANNTQGKSDWDSHSFAVEVGGSLPVDLNYRYLTSYSPYVKLQVVSVNQKGFQEVAADPRIFDASHLVNVSIPMGLTFKHESAKPPSALLLTLGYAVDAYRDHPHCLTSLTNGTSWSTFATNLSRQAFFAEASGHLKLLHGLDCFASGSCELRSSSRSYNANCGTRYSF
ncbi:Omp11 [Chlamydia pneumoniae TW-183]|uniref:Probable outer membrane protein pmp6 n=3 Tax=Chlamydia pneumoniae TaxID=83558 RepID=A0A0F7XLB4_CHLPN|nr:polymorphic outer membrane protein middle domain-containing protein [Chlamydia pneumoniae]AAD18588.1 Polymorphic Outer Membrane Protein G/I Family [Chlamydia pneumoniae CWL029]AAP98391.1 Omp11 [Chlamydia pneumoniae TW-183]CRI32947.1 Probable outer membrane protein pmp6 [Chlamydia pneumoniae]CRI36938.1 Probable outer membrane protein pmp6 [Chlamydia pneumoniae]CRI38061.1 Probable outer membrane protein pmp6 [Chlamydia pneumoniae]